ncbi:Tyrosine recombinase XerC [Cupriavidus yeoncheonensis]|uniref:Tyrosine recombinase XerC n=1 Tax=Cupriavidus yeoncheonensis TaxID=1462994 RepID=A0A916N427_9BURK|nr:site-specific integrase [Cupriavidus yeoncheonensis]CAG2140339.1 Tyrosine recombinase XerC [Cupriavidus yeoncheonensis]
MSIRLPARLHRNRHGILYYRQRIPDDLRLLFPVREVYRSLGTASVREAAPAAHRLAAMFAQLFRTLRRQMTSDSKTPLKQLIEIERLKAMMREQQEEADTRLYDELFKRTQEGIAHARTQRQIGIMEGRAATAMELAHRPAPEAPKPDAPLFSTAAWDYMREQQARGSWTPKTAEALRATFELFVEAVGDRPLNTIDRATMTGFLELLRKLPPNRNKRKEYAGMSLAEIAALEHKPSAPATINRVIERVSTLFKWCIPQEKYGITRNPAEALTIKDEQTIQRRPHTTQELVALFSSREFQRKRFKHSYTYWLMPMALLTGARLNELCQLSLNDIANIDGVQCISVLDEEEGQRTKNANARRVVPVHSTLIELGLLRHVERLRSAGESRLFPELKPGRDGFGTAASKWFGRYSDRCGVTNPETVFHSFRHWFITAMMNAGVSETVTGEIVGHETGRITSKVYYHGTALNLLQAAVEQVRLPTAVHTLIPPVGISGEGR